MGIVAQSQALVKWSEPQGVLPSGHYDLYKDARDGTVDYATRLNGDDIPAWPDLQGKLGLGIGPLGAGRLGRGTALGFGLGAFPLGLGPLGVGGRWREFTTDLPRDGSWKFAVVSLDAAVSKT